ncbi:hypothetical protein [Xinzhou toro-like virus]|uniref:Uncharacterized protein n=1 Tax=Xinzhou toro-like virus TaxID=1923777 RepID=A0A1L3KJ78_9NIDO|nr:hypothetical protein [Xinzhou toro-like virus]APG77355.1 hypothetical protein [Xinzhou toro-like virus]
MHILLLSFLFTPLFAEIRVKPPYAPFVTQGCFTPTPTENPVPATGLLVTDQSTTFYGLDHLMCSDFQPLHERLRKCELVTNPANVDFGLASNLVVPSTTGNLTKPIYNKTVDTIILFEGSSIGFTPNMHNFLPFGRKFYRLFYPLLTKYKTIVQTSNSTNQMQWTDGRPTTKIYPPGLKLLTVCFTTPNVHQSPSIKIRVLMDGKVQFSVFSANATVDIPPKYSCRPFLTNGENLTISLPKGKFIKTYGISYSYYTFSNPGNNLLHVVAQCRQSSDVCTLQTKACQETPNCLAHNLGPFDLSSNIEDNNKLFYDYLIQANKDSIWCAYNGKQYENTGCIFNSTYYTPFISNSPYKVWTQIENGEAKPLDRFNKILDRSRSWSVFDIDYKSFDAYDPLIAMLEHEGFRWVGGDLVKDNVTLASSISHAYSKFPTITVILCIVVVLSIISFGLSLLCSAKLQKTYRTN